MNKVKDLVKRLVKSSQEGIAVKLRVKAGLIALFPVVSGVLRLNGIEVLEADWVELAEWCAYGVAIALEVWGWVRALKVEK